MNDVAKEIASYIGSSKLTDEEYLEHYGTPRRSGRYPYGSGEDPYQHSNKDFIGRIDELKAKGWTETPENIKNHKEAAINEFGKEIQKEVIKALEANDKMYAEAKRYLGAADKAAAQADIVAALKKLQKDGKLANDNEQKPDSGKK